MQMVTPRGETIERSWLQRCCGLANICHRDAKSVKQRMNRAMRAATMPKVLIRAEFDSAEPVTVRQNPDQQEALHETIICLYIDRAARCDSDHLDSGGYSIPGLCGSARIGTEG